jgi:hypothetical protein
MKEKKKKEENQQNLNYSSIVITAFNDISTLVSMWWHSTQRGREREKMECRITSIIAVERSIF